MSEDHATSSRGSSPAVKHACIAYYPFQLDGVQSPDGEGLLQEDQIAKLEQGGPGSSRRGNQAGPAAAAAAEKLAEQLQADVSYCQLGLKLGTSMMPFLVVQSRS